MEHALFGLLERGTTFLGLLGFFRGMCADYQSLVTEEMCKNQPKRREASHLSVTIKNFCSGL